MAKSTGWRAETKRSSAWFGACASLEDASDDARMQLLRAVIAAWASEVFS